MPMKSKSDPEKYCERCGILLRRKRYGSTLEDMTRFLSRKYCSSRCSNSRGVLSQSFTQQHKISVKFRKERCALCGNTPINSGHLHVHHINGDWKDHRPENLQTLCVGCHLSLHNRGRGPKCKYCETKSRRHGMCQKHYQRWKKYGDPFLTKVRTTGTLCDYVLIRES